MKKLICSSAVAAACLFAGQAYAAAYNFNVAYDGAGGATLLSGDNPVGTNILPGDSFVWDINAQAAGYWHVATGGNFFPLMAFGVNEAGSRTGDFTLNLKKAGATVFSVSETAAENLLVHLGTNTIVLATGLDFDEMHLSYSLTSSFAGDPGDPGFVPGVATDSTINGLLPIFGAPELNIFGPGITFVTGQTAIPEPASLALLGLGLLGLGMSRRKSA